MRVLLVQHGAFPGFVAPIPKELAKHLARVGVDVTVASVGGGLSRSGETFAFPVESVPASSVRRRFLALKPLIDRTEIVHYFPGRGLEWLPLVNRHVKYIFNHISVSVTGQIWRDRLIDWAKRLQPSLADLVVCTDPALARKLGPITPTPVEILPVGYPADLFYPCGPFEERQERLLLYHGACRPQRRLERLIEAMPHLPARYRLMIIGGGTPADEAYRAQLGELAARLGCADRVVLTNMAQAEIRSLVGQAYLCLSYVPRLECFEDQFVLKTLEYLACGRPVLATATRYNQQFQREIGARYLRLCDDGVEEIVAAIEGADEFVRDFHAPSNLAGLQQTMIGYSTAAVVERRLVPLYERLLATG